MNEEKITGLEFLKDIPKTNGLVSAYGSVNLEQLSNVIKRFKKIPNYDEILKDNNKLQQENKQLKEDKKKAREYIKEKYNYILGDISFLDHDELIDRKQILFILKILGDDKE